MWRSALLCLLVACWSSLAHVGPPPEDGLLRRYFTTESNTRMLEAFYSNSSSQFKIVDCYAYGDKLVMEDVLQEVPRHHVIFVDEETLKRLIDFCTYAKWNGILPSQNETAPLEKFGIFSGIFIYPGTKWCGAGNISSSYDDLGPEEETDRCCRSHDHCHDSIPGRGAKYGLENPSPVTKSHCSCDSDFHSCLRKANTKTSHRVGRIFFNFLCMSCFKREHPIVECIEHKGRWPFRRCQEYRLDAEEEQIWQFFDAKHYEPTEDEEEAAKDEEFLVENFRDWEHYMKMHHLLPETHDH